VRVPQLGWNHIEADPGCRVLRSGHVYFANSYRLAERPQGVSCAVADHGGPFVAAMERGNLVACQFHPELSGALGATILRNWLELASEVSAC
jgi:imidazoleglycerol phosphate synthase glutamine amidotransferase subunit HisH